ncbi:MAG: response regulator transcription factor [Bacteroidota bacterium]
MRAVERTILLVEDEIGLAEILKFNLEQDGFYITLAHDGLTATGLLATQKFDLVLLDVMLPDKDGYEICKQFRTTDLQTPVVFITSRGSSIDRIHGLRLGANDYLVKPFEYDELLLRINNLLVNNIYNNNDTQFKFGKCIIDFDKMIAADARGIQITLSKIEFEMMKFFVLNKDKVISRDEIYKNIWGYKKNEIPNSRTLDNFIVMLRKYFEVDPSNPKFIVSIRGYGYKFRTD